MDDDQRYDDAVTALYSPLHQARTPEALKQAAARRTRTIEDMREYLKRLSLTTLPSNIVHVAGTKGKGSTACMCEAILRKRYGLITGLFTSPHLVDIRERIRVNGMNVSKRVFAEAYWEVRRRLEAYKGDNEDFPILPGFFRMMFLVALYVFGHYEPKIDVLVLEVGMGGRYDATNIFDMDQRNVVCGITLLDFDHTRVLGDMIEQIAWEKGGIFQVCKGSIEDVSARPTTRDPDERNVVPVANVERDSKRKLFAIDTNPSSALSVLRKCAEIEGRGENLYLVSEGDTLPTHFSVGLHGDHQLINAELAVVLSESLVEGMSHPPNNRGTSVMYRALANVRWPGRCQSVTLEGNDGMPLTLRLDGAHTRKSLQSGLDWFTTVADVESEKTKGVLIFNCSHERDPVELLQILLSRPVFEAVYFCRADFERPSMVGKPTASELLQRHGMQRECMALEVDASTWQETLANVWKHLEASMGFTHAHVMTNLSVRDALEQVRGYQGGERIEAFVTGSLYIVGSVLDAAKWKEDDAPGTLVMQPGEDMRS